MNYCPKCWYPIESGTECLCNSCGWFGDQKEILHSPAEGFNLIRAAVDTLELYRDVCRQELVAEQIYDAGTFTEAEVQKARFFRQSSAHTIIDMFVRLRTRPNLPKEIVEKGLNGMVPWPTHWTDRHYNGIKEPCDFLIGPCACGAWHFDSEEWVQNVLSEHQAVIVEPR